MSGFVKLYDSVITSSIWLEDDATLRVWIGMLVLADAEGYVGASIGGLAHVCRVTRDACGRALEILMSPDADSRTNHKEGRRVEKADRGWKIVNYRAYRERRSDSELGEAASCYVYYAVANEVVKIGSSKNPWARVKSFQKDHPEIRIEAVERGGYTLEFTRHAEFAVDLIDREWFRLSPALRAHIDALPKRTTSSGRVATQIVEGSDGKLQEEEEDTELEAETKTSSSSAREAKVLDVGELSRLLITRCNQGMKDNPLIGECYNPIAHGHAKSLTAAEKIASARVDPEFAASVVYSVAKAYEPAGRNKQISTLSYCTNAVLEQWEQNEARNSANGASRPAQIIKHDSRRPVRTSPGERSRVNTAKLFEGSHD